MERRRTKVEPVVAKVEFRLDEAVASRNNPESKGKNFKMADLPSFYHLHWTSKFMPAYIDKIGSDKRPWNPTFNTINTLQVLRDEVYPSSEHVVDGKGAVFGVVSVHIIITLSLT